ncbi:MAG: sigma-54-dependent transcriptional regulator [Clostridium sp.]|uniref:sigma-54-dependent transcriptional regulator n=1 Tax=Clostridium sp. TaxID=1506 RepID=UPI003D6C77F6
MNNKEKVFNILKQLYVDNKKGITAEDIANKFKINRSNISSYLNQLCKDGLVVKNKSRPVYFIPIDKNNFIKGDSTFKETSFSTLIGKNHSLKNVVEKAKASILYPPYGLHSIVYGETGVGKSMLAKYMYEFSIEAGTRKKGSPFITFNCADYANNPQLLMGHIFGAEKGAYTGAQSSKIGILEGADGGILFLDEIHRLPPEGQEMLFTFIDKGTFKRMGQSTIEIKSEVLIIGATTKNPESTLLDTFNRRIPMTIEIPPLRDRSLVERIELVKHFFKSEAKKINKPIKIHTQIMKSLLLYECKNNVGQLQSDIKLSVANSYLNFIRNDGEMLDVHLSHFNQSLNERKNSSRGKTYEVEILVPKDMDYYVFYPSGKEENFTFKEVKNECNDEGRSELSLIREGIRNNLLIENLFMDTKFFKLCENIKQIIESELARVLSEGKFYSMAIYIYSVIDNNSYKNKRNKPDINEVRQKNKEEFKVALKIINVIESEYSVFLPIEDAADITLFIAKKQEEEEEKCFTNNVAVIVAMHGDSTASSMVKAVKDILGQGNIYYFDMKLDKSYNEVVDEFSETIKTINVKDSILLFTDMGSLNSFESIIKKNLCVQVKTIPMVTTLMVLEALQKINIGFSLIEVYNSVNDMINYNFNSKIDATNNKRDSIIIIGYCINDGVDKESKKNIKRNLSGYIKNIEILLLPYEDEQDFGDTFNKLIHGNNIIALINDFSLEIKGIEYIEKNTLGSEETIVRLKNLIKINQSYYDIIEGLKSSLKYTNYLNIFEDIKTTIDSILVVLRRNKEYDTIIGLAMHLAFMTDTLVGKTRKSEKFDDEKLGKHKDKLQLIKKEMIMLERKYNIIIDDNECYGLLCILYDDL